MRHITFFILGMALLLAATPSTMVVADAPTEIPGRIASPQLEKCLAIQGTDVSNGTPVELQECGDDPSEIWTYYPNGEIRGYGDKCLDVRGAETGDGTAVQIWDCAGVENQKWSFNERGQLIGFGGKCVDVNDNLDGQDIGMWNCNVAISWGIDNSNLKRNLQRFTQQDKQALYEICFRKKQAYDKNPLYGGEYDCAGLADDFISANGDSKEFIRLLAIRQFKESNQELLAFETWDFLLNVAATAAQRAGLLLDHAVTFQCTLVAGGVVGNGACNALWTALTSDLTTWQATKVILCKNNGPASANLCKLLTDMMDSTLEPPPNYDSPCNNQCDASQTCRLMDGNFSCVSTLPLPPPDDPCSGQCNGCSFSQTSVFNLTDCLS